MKQQTQTNKTEWKEVELGDNNYFEILSSGINKFQGGKNYLSTESIKGTKIEKIECKITYQDRPSRANMQPVLNSVWFAKMKSTLKVYSFSKENEEEAKKYILSTGFAGIKFDSNVSSRYIGLFFLTNRFNEEKDKLSTGSTQSGINNSFIAKIKIPLPSLPNGTPDLKEQERIVSILERAEKLKQKGKNVGDLLDEYLKSVFWEMFYNKGFEDIKLGNEKYFEITMGQSPAGKSYNQLKKGMPFFQGKKEFGEKYPLVEQWTTEPSKIAQPNDILISVRAPVGSINLANIQCCIGRGLASIRCKKEIKMDFVYSFLKVKEKEIENLGNGSTFKAITSGQLLGIKIPLPPLHLQQKFSRIVEQVEKMKEEIKKTQKNSEELFNSLMQKAFKGEL